MTRSANRAIGQASRQALLAAALLSLTAAHAQEPRFADLLLTPNHTGEARGCCVLGAGGQVTARGVTARQLIEAAYRRHALDRREVIGGPSWLDEERFDFDATTGAPHAYDRAGCPAATFATLRAWVEHHVRVHAENRDRSVYALVRRQTGTLGPQLRQSDLDCGAVMRAIEAGQRGSQPQCGIAPYPGRLMASAITMRDFAAVLSGSLDRMVIDRTGLDGLFDVEVEGVEFKPAGPFGPSFKPSDATRSIHQTMPEQLGLMLSPVNASIEVIVVDSAPRPSAR